MFTARVPINTRPTIDQRPRCDRPGKPAGRLGTNRGGHLVPHFWRETDIGTMAELHRFRH